MKTFKLGYQGHAQFNICIAFNVWGPDWVEVFQFTTGESQHMTKEAARKIYSKCINQWGYVKC